ncbi:putative glycosylase [Saccharomonospora cyanea NA-134]|uniref:Putative glycosylase n=2 Tax=Saccharomonospora cyanea TaxID=40989 RepID=H5XJN9_9PSEU|nr:putative glycosylase [Saccharomonospora cyanea NA-134]
MVLVVALVAACTAGEASPDAHRAVPSSAPTVSSQAGSTPPDAPVTLTVDSLRGGEQVVASGGADAVYNYGPTVLVDGGTVRMWWCSQYGSAPPAGDDILYAQADSPSGPFTGPDGGIPRAVFSGNPGHFDAMHTCDPSVLRVNGTYYMYYTGARGEDAYGNAIGVATSDDGLHWSRLTNEPIVTPAHDTTRDNAYGAGQPAAVYLDGWFYLMFTDTTGQAAGWNGAGQFVLRSRDPAFATGVEALGGDGFAAVSSTAVPRTRSVVDAFSADLMWVDALDAFVIAHQTAEGTTLTFWNRDFSAQPYHPVLVRSRWEEGPGLVRQPDGHAPLSQRDVCGRVPFDVVHATVIGQAAAPTDLRHYGLDVYGIDGCGEERRALAVLDGVAMPSPVRTMDLVVGGRVVRVDRRSVATALAGHVLDERLSVLDRVPVSARLSAGARGVSAPGEGLGVVLDGTLWPVTSTAVLEANDSPAEPITPEQWRAYPKGPVLG